MLIHPESKRLIPLVAATLLSVSALALAANGEGIGTIVRSSRANLSGVAVPGEGTLTAGALLSTDKGGSAWVRFSAETQAGLSEGTSVRFETASGHVLAQLSSGTMAAKSSGKSPLVVETPRFTVEPAEGKAVYVVALLPDDTTIVSARQGDVSVTEGKSGKKHFLPAGHYAKISNAPAGTPAQAGSAAAGAAPGLLNDTPLVFAISVGAGLGTGFGIAEGPLGVGPASPSAP
jgi:hypothetical protein